MSKRLDEFSDKKVSSGEQFDGSRLTETKEKEKAVSDYLGRVFDARNIIPTEPGTEYDNFAAEKQLHQVLDYAGIDYVVDPLTETPFGVNHRTHNPTTTTLRFDIRSDTGTKKPSELSELRSDIGNLGILPRYASRFKLPGDTAGWFRVIELKGLIEAINDGLKLHETWEDKQNNVEAWMFDYSLIRDMGLIKCEFEVKNE
jgi:hypothetical protein